MPGYSTGHHWPVIIPPEPMEIIRPNSGCGIRTPAPTKLNPAVKRIEEPMQVETCVMAGEIALGRMCLKMMTLFFCPMTRSDVYKRQCLYRSCHRLVFYKSEQVLHEWHAGDRARALDAVAPGSVSPTQSFFHLLQRDIACAPDPLPR